MNTITSSDAHRPIGIKQVDFGLNDGKLDSLERYFLDTGLIDRLKGRKKFFILGRKGTGKTAIGRQLVESCSGSWNKFASLLSLRNVPVSLLEEFANRDQVQSGRYVLVWQLILLIELAKHVVKDEMIDPSDRNKLEAIILATAPTLSSSPEVYLKRTREFGFKVGVAGSDVSSKTVSDGSIVNLIDYTTSLREHLLSIARIGNSYRLVIDELDDSYADSPNYYDMIIALFKAATELNYQATEARKDCSIIVALRDDIYDAIDYGDKNKWSDIAIRIDWLLKPGEKAFKSDLFKMINLRIGASFADEPKADYSYWNDIFEDKVVTGDLLPFQNILSRTLYRPRDLIQFCKCVQDACPSDKRKAQSTHIREAELGYSDWLLSEVVDEIHVKLPKIREVFEAFRQLKQPTFTAPDIRHYLVKAGFLDLDDINRVLSVLYNFSVIGQFDDDLDAPVFRYRNPLIKFEANKKYSLHYGLRATLRLYGTFRDQHQGKKFVPLNHDSSILHRRERRKKRRSHP